jgi:DNA-nicking Smr family endonuclease
VSTRKAGKRGGLSREDQELWGKITTSVVPLRRRAVADEGPGASEQPPRPERKPARSLAPAALPKPRSLAPALAPIDRRLKQRLGRGTMAIEARLDLHGLTQAAARTRLESFLRSAQAEGHGLVLVITGKGREPAGPFGEERGVLRRQVPHWLALPDLRPYVIGFGEAGGGHGGAGALYVRVRRRQRI